MKQVEEVEMKEKKQQKSKKKKGKKKKWVLHKKAIYPLYAFEAQGIYSFFIFLKFLF